MRRGAEGFTLLEVAIGGAILLMGMMMVAQITRAVLDATAPDSPMAAQNSAVIEQYLRSEIAMLKSCRDATVPLVPTVPYGNGILQVVVLPPTHVPTTPASPSGIYRLMEYDVTVQLVQPGRPAVVVAHTRFWKLWRSDFAKAGV